MSNERYAFKDTDELVQTEQEIAARLGPEFVAAIAEKMLVMLRSDVPNEIAHVGSYVQGMYYAAVLFGRLDACLGKACMQAVVLHTTARLDALGVTHRVAKPHNAKAQVH